MVQMSFDDAAILSATFTLIGAVIGALIGALATIFAARLTAEKQQLLVESAKFRAAFVEEIVKLRSAQEDAFRILDNTAVIKHEKAKVVFEPWVRPGKLNAFSNAWIDYERLIKTVAPGNMDNRKKECDSAVDRIEKLLAFAKGRG